MFKINLKQINDSYVDEIPQFTGGEKDKRPLRGEHLFKNPFSNIFLLARKCSGKTSTIFKIIKERITRETKIYLFCSTLYKDNSWIQIRKYLEMKKIEVVCFTSIKEGGMDQLKNIVDTLEMEAKVAEEERLNPTHKKPYKNILLLDESDEEEVKPYKSKYKSPQILFVFDDLSTELQSPSLVSLMKKNRHFLCECIVSSQWITDLTPASRRQLDYILLYGGSSPEKLASIYKEADIWTTYDVFERIYQFATEKPYSFLYIDTRFHTFRRNFNTEININDIEK